MILAEAINSQESSIIILHVGAIHELPLLIIQKFWLFITHFCQIS